MLIGAALFGVMLAPLVEAAFSPLLQWRDPIYIIGGFAGIVALVLLVPQPLLISGALPGPLGRWRHIWIGAAILLAVVIHIAGLWITSPPDVVDVLLFRSPTPFGLWGAVAMWAVFSAALLGMLRKKISVRFWRMAHSSVTAIVVFSTVIHVGLIEGTMGSWSKGATVLSVTAAFLWALRRRKVWRMIGAR